MFPICYFLDSLIKIPLFTILTVYYFFSFVDNGEKSASRNTTVRNWNLWNFFVNYFSITLVKTTELNEKTYLFAFHPHGVLPFCGQIAIDLLLHAGAVEATSTVGDDLLKKGISIGVYPGGAEEALYVTPKEDVVVLSKRFGFIKMALRNRVPIVPVFTFNEGL
eukprot:gene2722-3918_t